VPSAADPLKKAATGIAGLDEVTNGGLPAGRATLVCGGPGCGKTLLATSFLVHGALHDGEPGVLMSFDERGGDLETNSRSLGFDLAELQRNKLLAIDFVHIDRQEIHETGEYDLEGLFIRLAHAVDKVKARRVVLDSIDTLFAGIPNEAILRAELRRLFLWLKERKLSVIITAERGEKSLSRHGIEEYVSDCVIVLESRVQDELATRRLRVVKYRGTGHGTNEYPFLITDTGLKLLPITSLGLAHTVSDERVSSGIAGLDRMLDGKGCYRGSSILVTGAPGTGKTIIGAHFALAGIRHGERCLYYLFEEPSAQLLRNMRTIGVDLQPAITTGQLRLESVRPTTHSLEMHLARMMHTIAEFKPDRVVVDPLSALQASGTSGQSQIMVLRLIDNLKTVGASTLYLALQGGEDRLELNISSLMDTWISVRNQRREGELERRLTIVKSRGMPHSAAESLLSIGADGVRVTEQSEAS
jgi:circadian clock protein KaiC